ncbi:MAG TPA: condensation domain-containing protein [Pyrinomonadaceae bacterium]|nr:condensation domain-containing protein [Pyrinomonadaceae bacterium]
MDSYAIAIVGMDGRFPGARNTREFWQNLRHGVESISFFADDELEQPVTPELLSNPNFVKAKGILDDIDLFDASFFNITPREAQWMDPQQRLFLECAWSAIEDAGYNVTTYPGPIAVYAGVNTNSYFLTRLGELLSGPGADSFQIHLANEKDHLATRVSYKLNLRGESVTIQTSCSTSLVAVHFACQSLLTGQCDMALAGGVSIRVPQKTGYTYSPGMISSPDGHCRAFDHKAQGTLPGNGVGIVVLKRLSDALADGDNIYAAIKGSAINNDGHLKMGYTAPSIDGQADVIAKALAMAAIDPDSLTFIEGHGTGTPIGDPIEVEALSRVFRRRTSRKGFCALGSVKTNIGHLDTASGVAGLIKASLAIKHREIPPTLHFEKPNPALDLDNTPFYVNNTLVTRKTGPTPFRAAVSSFGLGGTNAHVVLEEVSETQSDNSRRPVQLVTFSARTPGALDANGSAIADYLEKNADVDLADFAFTRNVGRQAMLQRRFAVGHDAPELIKALRSAKAAKVSSDARSAQNKPIFFMFPGQGSQHAGMARGLYESEPEFRKHFDECANILKQARDLNIAELIYGDAHSETIAQLEFALPALFAVEYALARLWMHWGVRPSGLIGHSYGEFVAAALAGMFTLHDAVCLAADRGRLMQKLPRGAMLSVRLPEAEARTVLAGELSIASVNSSVSSVISGPCEEIEALERVLADRKIGSRRLPVPFAYHSSVIDSILPEYEAMIERVAIQDPSIPLMSNLTGTWIEPGQATSASYWMDQVRQTVQFARGLDTLLNGRTGFLLEVGPNQVLTTMARQHLGRQSDTLAFASLPSQQTELDHSTLLASLGNLWVNGFEPDWNNFYAYERRRRVPTPTYPFERKRYWVDMSVEAAAVAKTEAPVIEQAQPVSDYAVQRDEMEQSYIAPRNAIEEGLAKIWAEILGMQGIGIHDNYFELGGDSLLATQMFSRIRQAFSVDISLEKVLFNQTIGELAREIYKELMPDGGDYESFTSLDEKIRERKAQFEPTSIARVERTGELPLSFAQEQLWLIHQVNPESAAYNLPSAVRLKGALDVQALQKSIGEVIRRHEILRTRFSEVDGRATQIIDPPGPIQLSVVELSEMDAERREAEAGRIVTEDARLPFDLAHGLAMRTFLLRLGEEDHVILLNVHHIASDAWSTGIFIQEIATLYEIFRRGEESPLPPLPIQYADYAYWQRNYLQGEKLESLVGYWKQQLSGASHVLKMATDRPRPDVQTLRGAHKSFNLPRELSESLRILSRNEGATLFMTLLSAFQTLLFRYSHQDDFCVGVPIAGRSLKETEGLIGCFINNLVLRARMSRDMKFRELLAKTREATLGAFAHQELPFAKVVEAVQPERSLSHSPLFQVIFDFRSTPREQSQELPELSLSSMGSEMGTAKLDLVLDIWDAGAAIVGSMEYNSDLFDDSTIALMLGRFEALLRSIVQQPDARLSALAIHTDAEKQDRIMMETERESSSRKRLLTIKPKPVQLPDMASV